MTTAMKKRRSSRLTVDPEMIAGAFSGDTLSTGAEDAEDDITGTLTFTDSIDGDTALTFTVSSDASNGSASVDASGAWTYAPNEHFNGSDSFTVKVTDDDGHEETQVITLTVDPVNDPGAFSGDTSGTGSEDDSSLTGTLTFTDSIDGDSAGTHCENQQHPMALYRSTRLVCGRTHRMTLQHSIHTHNTDDDGHDETQVITLTVDPVK